MRLSVVIAAHNEGAALWQTVQACHHACQQLEHELIVVDDASTDNSFELLAEKFPQQRVIGVRERQGASPSKHLGAQAACGDVLIFLDGHCKPENGALTRLLEAVEELHGEAVITPTIAGLDVNRWQSSSEQVGHGYVVELERFECGWIPLEKMKPVPLRRRTYYENPALIGCSLAVSRALYEKLRGFDAGMRIWGSEDLDFGLKCWLMGHRILHLPEAVVGHRFRSSFDNYQISGAHVAVNQLRMARKNYTDGVWNAWMARAQQRFQGEMPEHPEGLWARIWELFLAGRSSLEAERSYLLGHRLHDEFWYAEHFGLDWPQLSGAGSAPSAGSPKLKSKLVRKVSPLAGQQGQGQGFAAPFFAPSPSPPPPSSSSSSTSTSGGGGGSSSSSCSSTSTGPGVSSSSSSSSTSGGAFSSSSSSCSSGSTSQVSSSSSSSSPSSSSSGGGGGSSSSSSISPSEGSESNNPSPACNSNASGGCPCPPKGGGPGPANGGRGAESGNPVKYLDGNIVLSATDISSSGFGSPWAHQRTFSNQLVLSYAEMGQGTNWVVSSWPFLIEKPDGSIALVRGTTTSLWFDLVGGVYQGRYGSLSTLVHDTTNHLFILTSPDGMQQTFHDFDQTTSPPGEFAGQVEPSGFVTSVESYTASGRIAEIHRTGLVDGQDLTEAFVYTYTANDQVETLTQQRQLGTSGWENVRRAVYSYWDGTNSFGNAGDLQQVKLQSSMSSGWEETQSTVYRYYIPGQPHGFAHGLKFVIKPAVYQTMINEGVNPLTASDALVATYADNYFEFDSSRRVTLERIDGGAHTFTFAFTPGSLGGGINDWAMKTVEGRPDGSQKIVYTNSLGQALIEELTSGSDRWIDAYHYDDNSYLLWHAHPSAVLGYDDSSADLDISLRSSAGLIDVTTYYSTTGSGAVAGYVSARKLKQGATGTEILQAAYEYNSHSAGGTTIYPLSKQTQYRNTDGTGGQVTTYDYTFYAGTTQQQLVTTTLPVIPTSQNGSGVAATTQAYYDSLGRLTWQRDERGYISNTTYSLGTGGVLQTIQDVDTSVISGAPAGWSTPMGGGLNLITDYELDDRGRTIQSLGPVHEIDLNGTATNIRQASWTVYEDEHHVIYSGQGYLMPATSASTLINPVSIQQMDDGGKILANISAVSTNTSGTLQEIIDNAGSGAAAFPQSSYVRWQTTQYTQCCLVASQRVYFDIPSSGTGTEGTNYNQTNFGYDSMQRQNRTVTPGGTITDTVFDARGLTLASYVGTNDDGATENDPTGGGSDPDNNMVLITENVYDNGSGGGDGNLTQQTQYASASDTRVTLLTYDFRSRLLTTDGEIDYFQKNSYDNLNQLLKTERYNTTENGHLIARSETLFNDQGRQYRTIQYGVDPGTGTVGHSLVSNTWYDPAGNVIKSLPAGSKLFTKTTYDSLGRPTVRYVGYDLDETTYVEAGSVTDDTILEQSETVYDDASNVLESRQRQRYHNAPANQTGPLGDPNTTPKARVSYEAQYADGIGRIVAMANYGTNGGTALSRPSTIPARSDTILVTTINFDSAGNQVSRTDPANLTVAFEYDDAGRQITQITNPQPAPSSSSSSSSGGCDPSEDTNITVRTAYNPDGNVISITAENSATGDQTTQYVYGTTLSDSEIASSLLKRQEIYPDSVDASDVILFSYNRQQQTVTVTDQNGTVHTYDYDKLGRQTQDRVTTLGTGVDDTIRRIEMTYEVRGLREHLTSYDDATVGQGNIVNDVLFEYNEFGQLTHDYQSHENAVNPSTTPKVQYTYADGSDNTVRPTALVYPNGRELHYNYGSTGEMDDAASRVAALVDDDGTTHLVDYSYLGRGGSAQSVHDPFGRGFVMTDSPQPEVRWTMVDLSHANDPDTGDIYSGFDRFGRVKDNRWYNYDALADIDRIQYGYNRAGNRIWRKNVVADALGKHFDELYGNDSIQRLKDLQRGTLNGSHTGVTDETYAECWSLDETGNWQKYLQDDDGSGWDLNQSRTANTVNEITNISASTGPTWVTPAYSKAGNMTTMPQPADPTESFTATYDAWNRLVKLVNDTTTHTIATYQYDGAKRRVIEQTYTTNVLNETHHCYFTEPSKWQIIEERLGFSSDPNKQYVWGLRYIDEIVLRDRDTTGNGTLDERLYGLQDTNWNVTCLINTNGIVQERFAYSAYGIPEFLNVNFNAQSNTTSNWKTLYAGYRWDAISGLFHVRNRELSISLGAWIQRDPLGLVQGMNLTEYCDSNPVVQIDTTGNIPVSTAPVRPVARPTPGGALPRGWRPTAWPLAGKPAPPPSCAAPSIPPFGAGLPPTPANCISYWRACTLGNTLGCNGYWACLNGGADPANSCVRACLQTVGFPPPAGRPPVRPGTGFPATSPDCWCSYLQHLACFSACSPRAPGVAVPPWNIGGAGFNWCTFGLVCSLELTTALNASPWTTRPVPPCRWPTTPPPIGGPPGPCILY